MCGAGGGGSVGVAVGRLPVLGTIVRELETANYFWGAFPDVFWDGVGDITNGDKSRRVLGRRRRHHQRRQVRCPTASSLETTHIDCYTVT